MDLYEAMYTTRAMRRVRPEPIPADVLGRIFDAAVRGPSGGNSHTFRFVTVTDPDTKAALKPLYRDAYDELMATSYADLNARLSSAEPDDPALVSDRRNSESGKHFVEHLDEHPMLVFVFGKQGGESSTFPVVWNLCLAARAEGLGTFVTTLLRFRKDEVESLLGVDDDYWHMHAMIPIGYPTGRWGLAERRPAEELAYSERWGRPVEWHAVANWTEPENYGRNL